MAVLHNFPDSLIGVIPIEHSSEELLALLQKKECYRQQKSENRKKEWLTVRYLLYLLLGEEKEIVYLPSGKPRLADNSYHISISHTKGYVAIILNKDQEVGIDIEAISPHIQKVKIRFLNEQEASHIDKNQEIIHLLLHWSAKETLFKVMDENDIELQSQLHIEAFTPELHGWHDFKAWETRSENKQEFRIDYLITKDYVLTATHFNRKRLSL